MEDRVPNELLLRQRSEKFQISFENVLAVAVLEEIVQRIAESEYAENFWMKNSVRMNLDYYRKKADRELSFIMKDTDMFHNKRVELNNAFAELFQNDKNNVIHWSYDFEQDKNSIYINLIATILSIKVPIKIIIKPLQEENLSPYVKDITLYTSERQEVQVNCFPSEHVIVEKFLEVIEKLELLNDMSCYMDIYSLLKNEVLSGRKVSELLMEGCKGRGMKVDEYRMELLASYRTSSFLKKKWKSYMRHEKMKSPVWDEVMDMMENFFMVIWQHICRNLIYLEDWMPELGRFIDCG